MNTTAPQADIGVAVRRLGTRNAGCNTYRRLRRACAAYAPTSPRLACTLRRANANTYAALRDGRHLRRLIFFTLLHWSGSDGAG